LFYVPPDDILTYDYPGATYTSLNVINKNKMICGYYNDAAGVADRISVYRVPAALETRCMISARSEVHKPLLVRVYLKVFPRFE